MRVGLHALGIGTAARPEIIRATTWVAELAQRWDLAGQSGSGAA